MAFRSARRVHARRDARLWAFEHHEFDPQTPEAFVTQAMAGLPRWRSIAPMPLLQSTSSGAIFALGLGLEDALGLASAAVLIVLAGDRGEHVEHHGAQWAANMRP